MLLFIRKLGARKYSGRGRTRATPTEDTDPRVLLTRLDIATPIFISIVHVQPPRKTLILAYYGLLTVHTGQNGMGGLGTCVILTKLCDRQRSCKMACPLRFPDELNTPDLFVMRENITLRSVLPLSGAV